MTSWAAVCCSKPVIIVANSKSKSSIIEDMASSNFLNNNSMSTTTSKSVQMGCYWFGSSNSNTASTATTSATTSRACRVRASAVVDSFESSSNFVKRMEQAWLISQQPRPIACSSCNSKGHVECKWCGGTGFFILGDNMLCQVPSRNTSCIICGGKGSMRCCDCKGTGFRAKWLGEPPMSK